MIYVVVTTAYLALPVWGEGGPAAFFAQPALTAAAILTLIQAFIAPYTGGGVSRGVRE